MSCHSEIPGVSGELDGLSIKEVLFYAFPVRNHQNNFDTIYFNHFEAGYFLVKSCRVLLENKRVSGKCRRNTAFQDVYTLKEAFSHKNLSSP